MEGIPRRWTPGDGGGARGDGRWRGPRRRRRQPQQCAGRQLNCDLRFTTRDTHDVANVAARLWAEELSLSSPSPTPGKLNSTCAQYGPSANERCTRQVEPILQVDLVCHTKLKAPRAEQDARPARRRFRPRPRRPGKPPPSTRCLRLLSALLPACMCARAGPSPRCCRGMCAMQASWMCFGLRLRAEGGREWIHPSIPKLAAAAAQLGAVRDPPRSAFSLHSLFAAQTFLWRFVSTDVTAVSDTAIYLAARHQLRHNGPRQAKAYGEDGHGHRREEEHVAPLTKVRAHQHTPHTLTTKIHLRLTLLCQSCRNLSPGAAPLASASPTSSTAAAPAPPPAPCRSSASRRSTASASRCSPSPRCRWPLSTTRRKTSTSLLASSSSNSSSSAAPTRLQLDRHRPRPTRDELLRHRQMRKRRNKKQKTHQPAPEAVALPLSRSAAAAGRLTSTNASSRDSASTDTSGSACSKWFAHGQSHKCALMHKSTCSRWPSSKLKRSKAPRLQK